jgi:hypothetical protein
VLYVVIATPLSDCVLGAGRAAGVDLVANNPSVASLPRPSGYCYDMGALHTGESA